MKRIAILTTLMLGTFCIAGCPANQNQLQQAAQASENAAINVQAFENSEIAAHSQGLIPDSDNHFIQEQVATIADLGKTTDSCIAVAGTSQGALTCINSAITAIDSINASGGLYLKSPTAKQDFSIALIGVKGVLVTLETMLGAPAPVK